MTYKQLVIVGLSGAADMDELIYVKKMSTNIL